MIYVSPTMAGQESYASQRSRLQTQLLSSVRNCQTRFGGKSELATDLEPVVAYLCDTLEEVLCHGLKSKDKKSSIKQISDLVLGNDTKYSIWDVAKEILTGHERERYELLKQVWTDRGRARAWIRSAINERSLERYMSSYLAFFNIKNFYESWSFICDVELSSILIETAAGLNSILFSLSIDRPELNSENWCDKVTNSAVSANEEVIPEPVIGKKKTKVKKVLAQVISFGDEEVITGPNQNQIATFIPSPSSVNTSMIEDKPEDVECAEEAAVCEDLSDSETKSLTDMTSSGLRLLNEVDIGELIPVMPTEETRSSEDSISVPSFSEDADLTQGISESKDFEMMKLKLVELKDANSALVSQLAETEAQAKIKLSLSETKVQELNRENELLKHQLRKYVSAVQMLKEEGNEFEGEELYQQKLVQVAEMHGELMELNDRLHRNLIIKESVIRRLYLEIEALRGPLGPTEIEVSTSIISLWIPSVFMVGGKRYHVYQVHVRAGSTEFNVYRRYSEFFALHREVKKKYPILSAFKFPPKKTIGYKDSKFVEERRLKLQNYLRRLINHIVANNETLFCSPTREILASFLPFFKENTVVPDQQNRPVYPRSQNALQYSGL